jgi:hypothetical protein
MKKKILTGIVFFIACLVVSVIFESFLRSQVYNLYQWTTDGGIRFIGKNFYFFATPLYYLSFGISFLLFGFESLSQKIYKSIKKGFLWIAFFTVSLIVLCALDANSKIAVCTACEDGTRTLHFNEVNFGLMLGISALLSAIPNVFTLIKNRT